MPRRGLEPPCPRTPRYCARKTLFVAKDMYFHLHRGISSGDPRSIDAGVRVLAHKAKLNGYGFEPEQAPGVAAFSINIILGDGEDEQEAIPATCVNAPVTKELPKS